MDLNETTVDRANLLNCQLRRHYYFCEVMAYYEAYYRPISDHLPEYSPSGLPGRGEDRPLAWVPIVFHCTKLDTFTQIVNEGWIKPNNKSAVSLTEIPIGELDRMKSRGKECEQIAIGFPRSYIQSINMAPVLYTKHHPALKKLLEENRKVLEELAPFLALDDDVSAFQEIRTLEKLDISKAVWLLTTKRSQSDDPEVPALAEYRRKWGRIPTSFWHRSHQFELLGEWQYLKESRDNGNKLTDVEMLGEHYWQKLSYEETKKVIQMPAGKNFELQFKTRKADARLFDGPYNFFDLAGKFKILLQETTSNSPALPYAIMKDP